MHASFLFNESVFVTFIVKKCLLQWKKTIYVCTLKQQQPKKIRCLFKHSHLIKLLSKCGRSASPDLSQHSDICVEGFVPAAYVKLLFRSQNRFFFLFLNEQIRVRLLSHSFCAKCPCIFRR